MKNKKTRKKMSKELVILITGIIAISIPLMIFLWIIMSAFLKTGKPIYGDRFLNDLNPNINKSDISEFQQELKTINNLDDVEIILKTASFKIYLDFKDDVKADEIEETIKQVYNKVDSKFSINTYFKADDVRKMYDLEIHGYNFEIRDQKDNFIYYILNKNSRMDNYRIQLVSEAVNPDLVKELKEEIENTSQE